MGATLLPEFQQEVVSWDPRVFIGRNLMTVDECKHIMDTYRHMVEPSVLVDEATGKQVRSTYRDSQGAFLSKEESAGDEVIERLQQRIAQWTHLPPSFGEDLYLLQYNPGQQYQAHVDFFDPEIPKFHAYTKCSGQRVATVLTYLASPEEGGHT